MLENYLINFISIVLEALPFVFIGTLISSSIEIFIPQHWIEKRLGHNKPQYYIVAGLIGLFIPICECAIVPVMRRLIQKGIPPGIAITFMLATPIVNPVVLLSTFYAFSGDFHFVIGRGVLGFIGAIMIGMILSYLGSQETILKEDVISHGHCGCSEHHCGENHFDENEASISVVQIDMQVKKSYVRSFAHSLEHVLNHLSGEFLEVGKYVIFGAMIASAMQTFISRGTIVSFSGNPVLATAVMMALAFVLSLCSEADAFIASTFRGTFTNGSIMAFLIMGPMIDVKNTLMLLSYFRKGFVIRLIVVIVAVCFFLSGIFQLGA